MSDNTVTYELPFSPRRTLRPGSMFKVDGTRAVFEFDCVVTRPDGTSWIEARGGKPGRPSGSRAFPIDAVTKMLTPREVAARRRPKKGESEDD